MVRQKKARSNDGHSSFHIGDRVRISFGRDKVTGVIVEDVGAFGVGGRRLFRVNIPMDPFEPMMMELPEDDIEAAATETEQVPLDKQKVIEYLAYGGLIAILRSNMLGGVNQPRVWLCRSQLGNVTHTFDPDRGLIGGQTVPSAAVRGVKIFAPKRDAVVPFVESFGLTHEEAEAVVSRVRMTR